MLYHDSSIIKKFLIAQKIQTFQEIYIFWCNFMPLLNRSCRFYKYTVAYNLSVFWYRTYKDL